MTKIILDDSKQQPIIIHQHQECSVTFTLSSGDTWSDNPKIKVGIDYAYAPIKIYTKESGLTVSGQTLTWVFSPTDWENKNMVYDALLVREANNQRDFFGTIILNKAFK